MRIVRLDLLKFGPFTDVSLAFGTGPFGLHIVFGPNEAGKSSALRALRQFFYGIPTRTSDNFLHTNADLRIGAILESVNGEVLHAIRRKTTAQTLRDQDDEQPVDAARLAAVLGGIDEAAFSQRFGIDYQELVRGGAAIAQGGGDLGSMLFAVGLGIADLTQIVKRLTDEADEYFKARGTLQRVNKAVAELAAARRTIKECQLPEAEWVAHDRRLGELLQQTEELSAALLEKRTQQGRLQRLADALPVIHCRKTKQDELQEVADTPVLAPDFAEHRRTAAGQLQLAETTLSESLRALAAVTAAIDGLHVPPLLLEHAGAIQQLKEDLGIHRKAMKDRTGLVAKCQQIDDEVQQIVADLGPESQPSDPSAVRIGRAQRRRIQELGNRHAGLSGERETAHSAQQHLQQQLAAVQRQIQSITEERDASELRRVIRRAQQHPDLEARLERARRQLDAGRQQLQISLQRLPRWSGTLAELEALPVPCAETIDRFENALAQAAGDRDRIGDRMAELHDELSQLDQSIQQLRLQADVPTESDLSAARATRAEGWRLVRRAWQQRELDPDETAAFIARLAPGADLATAYEASVAHADELADRLRREADRVAEKAKLIAEHDKKQQWSAELSARLANAQRALGDVEFHWRELWQPLGMEPGTPREMRAWRSQQAAIVAEQVACRTLESEHDELACRLQALRDELSHALQTLGAPDVAPDESLACALERCEQLTGQIESAREQQTALARDCERLSNELADADLRVARIQEQMQQWQQDWTKAMEGLPLGDSLGPAEAHSVLESIQDLHGKLSEAERLRERIEGIEHDAEAFSDQTRRLAELAAPDLAPLPVEQAANDLYDRLITAQKEHARLVELQQHRAREERKRDEARALSAQWQATLEEMCREARCQSPDQLAEVERMSRRKQELESAIRELSDRLHQLAAGVPLDDFIQQALAVDADKLSPALQELADEIRQLDQQQAAVREAIGQERSELARMDGSSRAAEAQARAESLAAQIRTDAEQYARLRIASTVLQNTTERYREKSQGPVLESACRLFEELTLGSFHGLRADFDDKGGAVLVGVRPGGQTLGVEAMSDGTRDQLYLALRLASLETYLAEKEPLPFVVDDILIMFDDDRSTAALRALARLSARTQVIYFTHHAHVVDLTSRHLDHGSFCVHQLEPAHNRA